MAVEYLVLSQCLQEAFELAKARGLLKVYAGLIDDNGRDIAGAQFELLAEHFRTTGGDPFLATKFNGLAGQRVEAIRALIALAEEHPGDEPYHWMIEFAAEEGADSRIVGELIEFLLGERDDQAKDPRHLFQLYVRLQMVREAAKTAVIIADEQQQKGFYKMAHDLLFDMYCTLREAGIRAPSEIVDSLQLLHSYLLIKTLVKRGDDRSAARLIMRVVAHLGKFPAHIVQILTSAVITCSKAGFHGQAFRFASQLLQPENRPRINAKYKRKVEQIVRRGTREDDPSVAEDPLSPYPHCDAPTPSFQLHCSSCRAQLPYCILTGRHVDARDFAVCPLCGFPGTYSEFNKLVGQNCPMCEKELGADQIQPSRFLDFAQKTSAVGGGTTEEAITGITTEKAMTKAI